MSIAKDGIVARRGVETLDGTAATGPASTSPAAGALVQVPEHARELDVEQHVVAAAHTLHEHPLFSDAALAALIERHPPEDVHIHHMSGSNESPVYLDAELGTGTGAAALAAIARGRLWMSLVNVEQHPEHAELLDALYDQLEAQTALRTVPGSRLANLLISSPTAEVFYHADAHPVALWHIRGRKRLYVYPSWDDRFLSRDQRELCLLGMLVDDTYRAELDHEATVFDMAPGDVVTWPQSTPHRVVNVSGLNVSLSSEHHTSTSRARRSVAAANWFLRNRLRIATARSLDAHGIGAWSKRAAYCAFRTAAKLAGRRRLVPADADVVATIRLDASDPRGYVEIG